MRSNIFFFSLLAIIACHPPGNAQKPVNGVAKYANFGDFWYQGKAELNRYELSQVRYGDVHQGDAVLIFVTEPFLKKEQVKRDFGNQPADSVLKLNGTRKFVTGIYPYSTMTSVFTTVDQSITPKVSFSSQEWCGHVFMQLNRKNNQYHAEFRSYFQNEGDQQLQFQDLALEDELMVQIRINPEGLPLGKFKILPSLQELRLSHKDAKPYSAEAKLTQVQDERFGNEAVSLYHLRYEDLNREVLIYFSQKAPYEILGWEEVYGDLKTTAVRTHVLWDNYWSHHNNQDRAMREKLGLSQ